jgi:His-Xaa-Ser system radical SAM maturase HxsB
MALPHISRKFKDPGAYHPNPDGRYYLLPFRFHRLTNGREVLVNEVGDYLIVPSGTAHRIARHAVKPTETLYGDLLSSFFISETPIPALIDVLATRYRTKKAFLDSFTALHIFVLTLRCNHSCHYCQVSRVTENRTAFDMGYAEMDLAIDHLFRSPAPAITMEFQGGEPLLAFPLLRYAVERALELNQIHQKELNFVICTNLTVLTDDVLAFCRTHRILLSTSLDGPAFIHNANRPKTGVGSYQLVIEGLQQAREWLGVDQVSALMTTSLLSLDYPIEIIDSYLENQFSNIFLRPISPFGFAVKNQAKNRYETQKFIQFYQKALQYILTINQQGGFFAEDYSTILLQKMLTPFTPGYVDLQSPAGLVTSVVVYNYDGYVYASDEARMLAEKRDYTFRLGHVRQSYDQLFLGPLARSFTDHGINETMAGCSDCGFQSYCGADPVLHHATQGDMIGHKAFSSFCQKNMALLDHLFTTLDEGGTAVETIFRSWVSKRTQSA